MKKLIYILLFTTLTIQGQSIDLAIYQDAKLGLVGDEAHGIDAGTLNIIARLKMNGMQLKNGYVVGFPEFEYANIDGIYKRYSLNMGYTFNQFSKKIEASAYGGWGFIDRYGKSFFSAAASFELAYIINKIKISLLAQFTERKDLKWLWGTNEIRFSGFLGIQYQIFKQ